MVETFLDPLEVTALRHHRSGVAEHLGNVVETDPARNGIDGKRIAEHVRMRSHTVANFSFDRRDPGECTELLKSIAPFAFVTVFARFREMKGTFGIAAFFRRNGTQSGGDSGIEQYGSDLAALLSPIGEDVV
jgi:hypothetical protein